MRPRVLLACRCDALLSRGSIPAVCCLCPQRCVTYIRLFRSKAEEIEALPVTMSPTSASGGGAAPAPAGRPTAIQPTALAQSVAELAGVYATLEEKFLRDGLRMALEFDEVCCAAHCAAGDAFGWKPGSFSLLICCLVSAPRRSCVAVT